MSSLADIYFYGMGVNVDYKKAVYYYSKAADKGYAVAQYQLGICYSKGLGVEKDYVKAVEYFKLASSNGLKEATDVLNVIAKSDIF